MFKLSKKVEYAILAVQYMAMSSKGIVSAKEIAEKLNISFEFLSKALQKLMKYGIIESKQGIRGGYVLSRPAEMISLADIINAQNDEIKVVDCLTAEDDCGCTREDDCTLRSPMQSIQQRINTILKSTSIADICGNNNTMIDANEILNYKYEGNSDE